MYFVCEKCNTLENTVHPQHYLATLGARVQLEEGMRTEGIQRRAARPLACSACEPRGRWHEKFPRRQYNPEQHGPMNKFRQLVTR